MVKEAEYHDAMMHMLELIWGEGFMAPGGTAVADDLVRGLELRGKCVLDIGSGLGGPACHLAEQHGAQVTGIDIEPQLVRQARQRAEARNLLNRVSFLLVQPGSLPFPDASFDLIVSAGAFTQIADKHELFTECLRVLKPGGAMRNFDWTTTLPSPSEELRYFFEMEGLTYALETPESYAELLAAAGFTEISIEDDTDWYRLQCRKEYEMMQGDLYPRMVDLLGRQDAEHFVEDWRSMVVVFEKGDLTQTICRSRKPGQPAGRLRQLFAG